MYGYGTKLFLVHYVHQGVDIDIVLLYNHPLSGVNYWFACECIYVYLSLYGINSIL